jgi:acetoin utilization deacetylase AcuC-like enzyme
MASTGAAVFLQQVHSHVEVPGHPERAERLEACLEVLDGMRDRVAINKSKSADREQLAGAHSTRYLDALERFCDEGGGRIDQDTYAAAGSFRTAASASGACCEAIEHAFKSNGPGFSVVRPPGHHAGADYAMGFCLINHSAVGIRHALESGAEKIYVVDFDVHHGNGTQDIFYNDERVVYLSIHQSPWYPGTGDLDETGGLEAPRSNFNIPLRAGAGDDVYLSVFNTLVAPIGRSFQPDLIVVSAGYDAHSRDPLALMEVTTTGFRAIAANLMALAGEVSEGRIVFTLEGGYDLEALSGSFAATLEMLADPADPPSSDGMSITPEVEEITAFHSSLWHVP